MRQDREPTGLLCRWVETSNTSLNGAGALCVAVFMLTRPGHSISGHSERAHCLEDVCILEGALVAAGLAAAAGWASDRLSKVDTSSWSFDWSWNWSWSSATPTSYAGTGTSVLSNTADLAGAIGAQARAQGRGNGSGRYNWNHHRYRIPTGHVIPVTAAVTATKPVIDQNVNNGKHPKPAPSWIPKPDWDPKNGGGWKPEDGWKAIISGLQLLNILTDGDEGFSPDQVTDPHSAPGANPDGSNGDDHRDGDCRIGGNGWRYWDASDSLHGNRAMGVEACLDAAFLRDNHGDVAQKRTFDPPGYSWARNKVGQWGAKKPEFWINACHLLGDKLSGDARAENLVTCSRQANAWSIGGAPTLKPNMLTYESQVRRAIEKERQVVHYKVTPLYEGPRTVPYAFRMEAQGWMPGGGAGIKISDEIPNWSYGPSTGRWHDLGRVTEGGRPVPTRAHDWLEYGK